MSITDSINECSAGRLSVTDVKRAFGHFSTGVTVITGSYAGKPHGFTCQSFAALSLKPTYISFCPSKSSESWPPMRASGAVSVNILASDQANLSAKFARRGADRFSGTEWSRGANGSPALAGVLARMEADIVNEFDAGDHLIAVAELTDVWVSVGKLPLLYYQSGFACPHGCADSHSSDAG